MDQAMKCYAGHNVDEETGNLVEAVEDHAIPPHCYGDSVVSESQTICADE